MAALIQGKGPAHSLHCAKANNRNKSQEPYPGNVLPSS